MTLFLVLLTIVFSFLLHHSLYFLFPLSLIFCLSFCQKKLSLIYFFSVITGLLLYRIPPLLYKLPSLTHYGVIVRSKSNYFLVWKSFRLYYVNYYDNPFKFGDIITINGEVADFFFITLESEFDFGRFLISNGAHQALINPEVKLIRAAKVFRFFSLERVISDYDLSIASLLRTLISGERVSQQVVNEVPSLHVLTFLSISGFHLSLLRRYTEKFFTLFLKPSLGVLFSYALLVLLFLFNPIKFAFYRIFLTGFLFLINTKLFNKRLTSFSVNICAAFIFIIINPYVIYNPSFYLAYTLIFLFNLQTRKKKKSRVFNFFTVYFVFITYEAITSSTFHLFGTISQLIYAPFYIMIIVSFFFSLFFRPFSLVVTFFSELLLKINIKLIFLRFEVIVGGSNIIFLFVIITFFVFFYYFHEIRIIKYRNVSFILILISFALKSVPISHYLVSKLFFINVGQGDSTLVLHRGKAILIDTGGLANKDIANDVLIPFFKKQKVRKLDYVIITHDHYDHNGALPSLIKHNYVQNVITDKASFPVKLQDLIFQNLNSGGYHDENLDSFIVHFTFFGKGVLVMGDAYKENEAQIIRHLPLLNVDLLKVGHHGSKTSTSEAFIRHYKPREAIISCGYNNKHGHPDAEVSEILEKYNVKIRRTDLEGTITFKSVIIKP